MITPNRRNVMKRWISLAALITGACAGAAPAAAQDYPARPVRAITALVAGGLSDVFMRLAGDEFQKALGQPIVVENRPGGSLNIGGRACAEAPADGYTICILPVETLSYNKFLFKKLPFDPDKDFAPITNLFFVTQALVVNAAMKVATLDELAALSRARPGTLSYVAPSVPLSLFMDKFKQTSGADLVKVPYRGGGDAVNGILSGSTPIAFLGLANVISHLRAGTMTALAVDGEKRSPLIPEVPTLRELGYRGDITQVYFGLVAPAGAPAPIIAKLNAEFVRIGSMPAFRQKNIIDLGLEPILDTPEQFARYLRDNTAIAARIVRESGLELQ
jgi:tripartite-type tricarboxylate transporter receptor subunit TctC